ncbi:uncharacterized protein N7515_003234 [Penicillium bovifimosum]|uniref:Uncharacterized protein n=1 Tax=Penicillium bovifimosum TaxID=126998 RepID=A0A9W9H4Q4_9EURO|nr:uncharacterized protein N7515_003234 [Penicillium bovifimosum]KAJ5138386.1 hypothetical protein N7515_003234 [Penicillium bovifimosum]
MFEDFSFTSPSSRPSRLALDADDRLMVDTDSNLISPLSSRCPSPQSQRFRNIPRPRSTHFHRNQPPTSVPFPYEDHKRLSISTLTQKLHEHTLASPTETRPQQAGPPHSNSHTRRRYQGYVLTPPDTDHSDDSGVDCLSSPSASSITTSPTFLPPDLLSDCPELSLNANANAGVGLGLPFNPQSKQSHSQYQDIRLQRQQISQLQCNQLEVEAMQRSLMDESADFECARDEDDCHPSSLPPRASPRRRALTLARSRFGPEGHGNGNGEGRGRRKSSVGAVLSSRVEKSHFGGKRGEQGLGLRRKSLVSAALASMAIEE